MEIYFILVEPAVPENIGAAARAVKTMGFKNLMLVNPVNHLQDRARWLAHASNDILEHAQVFPTLAEAVKDMGLVVGTTAKKRNVHQDHYTSEELPALIAGKRNSFEKVAIVFGREESGLTNQELKLCDIISSVPLRKKYPSLNLGQAVMIYCYALSKLVLTYKRSKTARPKDESFHELKRKVGIILQNIAIGPNSNFYPRVMERLGLLNDDDIKLLHSITTKIIDKQPIKKSKE